MTTAILAQPSALDSYTQIDVQEQVISAETARRKASFFLAMNVGHLLRADNPLLLLGKESLKWQLDILLTSPDSAKSKTIGRLYLNAEDGSIPSSTKLIEDLTELADDFAVS